MLLDSIVRSSIAAALDGVISVALAPACAACCRVLDTPSRGPVCAACWSAVVPVRAPLCRCCGDALASWRVLTQPEGMCPRCRRMPPAFDRARAAGEYEGALREIIHAFKYDGRRSLASGLARMMRSSGGEMLHGADYAVPVPLHPWRRLRRGFNQAEELARHLDLPIIRAIWRTRATPPQAGLSPAQRRRNVRHAFVLSPLVGGHRGTDAPRHQRLWSSVSRCLGGYALQDRCVLLVDDVQTTCATLDACARVLKDAGVREVRALTVARAALPRQ